MLTLWSKRAGGPKHCLIVAQTLTPVTRAKGLSPNPHVAFADCPALDYLLVQGGQGTRREVDNPVLLEFIATPAQNCRAVLSVCTGAFVLHAAGLLSGRKATTHWASLDRLRTLGDGPALYGFYSNFKVRKISKKHFFSPASKRSSSS